ncbi:hypothetical protein KDAU_13100 [Dictyobacter aurantiacus]|uniref:Uncharacterized protein n=1 Tax=Dictyobacter aurantiacus TaxID=1936993 RepID=A0A401ZAS4_9CHLR|nr:hypothetical protein KDAU_13100 [Dictyobacter aurantiacus]
MNRLSALFQKFAFPWLGVVVPRSVVQIRHTATPSVLADERPQKRGSAYQQGEMHLPYMYARRVE